MRARERLAWSLLGLLVTTLILGGGYQATNLQNGDVNGDGGIDVGDAVYLLTYLFQGGPSPVKSYSNTTATGQMVCYGTTGSSWFVAACGDPAVPEGQDASYMLGVSEAGRFQDNGDGTLIDQRTGLMWKRNAVVMSGGVNWPTALQLIEDLEFAGHSDWRMPNAGELLSLARGLPYQTYDPVLLPDDGGWTWSSTTLGGGSAFSMPAGGWEWWYSDKDSGSLYAHAVRGP